MSNASSSISLNRPVWGKHVIKKKPDITPDERIRALIRQQEENKRFYRVKRTDIALEMIEDNVKDAEGL